MHFGTVHTYMYIHAQVSLQLLCGQASKPPPEETSSSVAKTGVLNTALLLPEAAKSGEEGKAVQREKKREVSTGEKGGERGGERREERRREWRGEGREEGEKWTPAPPPFPVRVKEKNVTTSECRICIYVYLHYTVIQKYSIILYLCTRNLFTSILPAIALYA